MSETDTPTAELPNAAYEGWAIIELMGHRQTAGRVAEVQLAGVPMLRIDTPGKNGKFLATQFYGGSAIYCATPCDEATAKQFLAKQAYNLPPAIELVLSEPRQPSLPSPDRDDWDEDEEEDERF